MKKYNLAFDLTKETAQAAREWHRVKRLNHLSAIIEAIYKHNWHIPGSAQTSRERREACVRRHIQSFLEKYESLHNLARKRRVT